MYDDNEKKKNLAKKPLDYFPVLHDKNTYCNVFSDTHIKSLFTKKD